MTTMTTNEYAERPLAWILAPLAALAVGLLLAATARGQEWEPEPEPDPEPVVVEEPMPVDAEPGAEDPGPAPIAAAGWCVVHSGVEAAADDDTPGCDVGAAVALYRRQRLSWVGVMGAETLGTGLAWVAHRGPPVIAVAVGVVVRYSTDGIDGSEVYPAIGATVGFGGRP